MNSTESNRAKNRLSAPSAQPAGPSSTPGRAPSRLLRLCHAPRVRPRPRACCPARLPLAPREPQRLGLLAYRARAPQRPGPRALEPAPAPAYLRPQLPRPCAPSAPAPMPRTLSLVHPVLKWAVAHFRFLLQYIYIFFSLSPATGKFQKKNIYTYIYTFIFHNTQIHFYKKLFSSILFSFTM